MRAAPLESAKDAWKRLYRFEEWGEAGPHPHALSADRSPGFFVKGHVPPPSLVPGDTRHAELLIEARGQARCTQAIWRLPAAQGHALVRIDTHEARSRQQARELLLALVSQVQFPLERWREEAPGEVAFVAPHGGCAAFVRGNLTAFVATLGGGAAAWAAQRFDALLSARAATPDLRAARWEELVLPPAFKAFVEGGDVVEGPTGIRMRAARQDTVAIEVYALDPPAPTLRRILVDAHPDP